MSPRELCRAMFDAAVARAQPAVCLPEHFPPAPLGRLLVLACGKSGAQMSEVVRGALSRRRSDRAGAARRHLRDAARLRPPASPRPLALRPGIPFPTQAGLKGTADMLALAEEAGPDDLALVLLSGGGSANWIAPATGIGIADKQRAHKGASCLGRTDLRHQHRPQASFAHQGRAARRPPLSGALADPRHLRRAGRRPFA